jgi:hypothetical protein
MKQALFVAAVVAAFALPSLAAEPAAVANANLGSDISVAFVDGPTGFKYVWRPNLGWQFVGQNPEGSVNPAPTSSPDGFAAGAPLAEFIDATTGFHFVWRHQAGWEFVGVVDSRQGELSPLASIAGDAR